MVYIPTTQLTQGTGSQVTGSYPSSLVSPYDPRLVVGTSTITANSARGVRVVIPKTGTLRDIAVYQGATSGNISVAIYTADEPRSRVYTTGAIASPAANGWRIIGDPMLSVVAGEQYDFAWSADNATAAIGRVALVPNTAIKDLPAGFLSGVTESPRLFWQGATLHPLPTSIAEADIAVAETGPPCIIARIE